MQSRKYYEAYWSQYDDVVTLNEFRKMLGGLGEVQARRLLQNKFEEAHHQLCQNPRGLCPVPKGWLQQSIL